MKYLRVFLLIFAVGLAVSIIYALGPEKIWANLKLVGWKIGIVFLIGFPRYWLYTLGWKQFLPQKSYSMGRLFQIKVAGELITRSTPIHFLGGDTARVFLMGRGLPRDQQTSSVIMDRTVMTLAGAVVILFGLILGSFRLPLPIGTKIALWILVGALFWGLFFIIAQQKKTALTSLVSLVERIGFRRWIKNAWREKISQVDALLRSHYEEGHLKLVKSVLILFVARLTVAFEIYLFIRFLGLPMGLAEAVILSSMSLLLTVVFFVFPGNFGILEGTYAMLFYWLGLDPALGVSIELLRKINAGLWYFVGAVIALTFKREARGI